MNKKSGSMTSNAKGSFKPKVTEKNIETRILNNLFDCTRLFNALYVCYSPFLNEKLSEATKRLTLVKTNIFYEVTELLFYVNKSTELDMVYRYQ